MKYMLTFLSVPPIKINCIGCVIVSVLASSVVARGFKPRSGQTKDHKIDICFSAKHAALRGSRIMYQSGAICLSVAVVSMN